MPEAASWPAFRTHWQELQDELPAPPFVLIDLAGVPGGPRGVPTQALQRADSLFDGDLADELSEVAPVLAQAASWGDDVARALWPLIDRREALLLWPADGEWGHAALRRHLRKFNVVYSTQGVPHFFRFYDARVLLRLLDSAEPLVDLRALLAPLAGLLTVDGTDEIRRIALREGVARRA